MERSIKSAMGSRNMEHIAIMKKSWGLTDKILSGQKKIESRWYSVKYRPWDRIKKGETVYFKDSGEPVRIRAEVSKVIQFANLTPKKVKEILDEHGKDDGIENEKIPEFFERFKNKRYCILIFLKNPTRIEPFEIDKTGFGTMSAWITVDNISKIKIKK
jgi:ASC-1-like (ASCH) protein